MDPDNCGKRQKNSVLARSSKSIRGVLERLKNIIWYFFLLRLSIFPSILVPDKDKNYGRLLTLSLSELEILYHAIFLITESHRKSTRHVLSFSGGTPCTPVWEENSLAMFTSPLSLESWMGSSNRTLAVFLSLTPGGLPRRGFLKNTSSTGAWYSPHIFVLGPPWFILAPGGLFRPLATCPG